jgi:outer membrane immunogenic protein
MKKFLFLSTIVFALTAGPALAADLCCTKAPPPPCCAWSWAGFYIGGNAGAGWASGNTSAIATPPGTTDLLTMTLNGTGAVGGVQAGYNWQLNPSMLLGLEGDWDAANINVSNSFSPVTIGGVPLPGPTTATASRKVDWLASIRGRLGVTFNQTLLYVTGGAALSRIDYAACFNCNLLAGPSYYPTTFSSTKTGGVAGVGVEQALAGKWSARAEYLYYQFGGATSTAFPTPPNPPFTIVDTWAMTKVQTARVGLDYKFGGP